MIQVQTILKVSDNSGAKAIKCIKILGYPKKRFATVGDTIIGSVCSLRQKNKINSKVKKGNVYRCVILRTKKKFHRKDGSSILFSDNSVCLLNTKEKPFATRIFGPLPKEFRSKKFMRLINISSGII